MKVVTRLLRQICADRRGLSSTELGIVLALVALGSIQALSSLGREVEKDLDTTKTEVADNKKYADPFARGPGNNAAGDSTNSRNGGTQEPAPVGDPWQDWSNSGGDEPSVAESRVEEPAFAEMNSAP